MKKINAFYLYRMRNNEHFEFLRHLIALIKEIGAEALKITVQFAALLAVYAQEDEALLKVRKSILSDHIAELDRQRNDTFRGLVDAIKSMLKHFNSTVQACAKRSQIVFKAYGNIARMAMEEKNSACYNLIQELYNNYAEDVLTLGINGWLKELERINTEIERLIEERDKEATDRTDLVLSEVRKNADETYAAMARRIEALMEVEGEQVYSTFIDRLNTLIDRFNTAIAVREGMAKSKKGVNDKKKDEDKTATPPNEEETTDN